MISAKEMFEAIANRVRAPIFAKIIFFSVALNWDNFLIFFFADNPIEDRIASLKSDFNFLTYLIAPTLLGVIWTFVFGYISWFAVWITSHAHVKKQTAQASAASRIELERLRFELERNQLRTDIEGDIIERAKRKQELEGLDREIRAEAEKQIQLAEPISIDSLQEYARRKFPGRDEDRSLAERIYKDLDKSKYQSIRDIDEVVEAAREWLDNDSKSRPDMYTKSLDFVSKSLGFTDREFRRTHGFSKATEIAFEKR